MKKLILIFGGGLGQLTLIRAAKQLGVISVVIDPNPDAPGRVIADFFYCVDGNDYKKTKQIAIKHNINGIVTGQMEKPLKIMARLAVEMGYIFHSPEVVEKCTNKYIMKSAFQTNNIPCAQGKLFKQNETINPDSLIDMTLPVILKPLDSFSSQGVYKINKFEEIKDFIPETRSFSSDNSVLIEEFIEGPEYSIESVTYNKKTTIVQYTQKIITPFPNTVEMGHVQPAKLENERVSG
ncbi:MAG: ATP-grasp domain-containing protein, partial [Desulfobacteraceae bacterium]|nr:ATP-grasp domain-containing protein [Desulfobacteraceae bacterium]